jgi:hypothetical protein
VAKFVASTDGRLPTYFNIDGNVGRGGANNPEDVALVSFLMRAGASCSKLGPNNRKLLLSVKVTSTCTPELIKSIEDFQRFGKERVDGHISVAHGFSYGTKSSYDIIQLNYLVKDGYKSVWPRLDKIQGCPSQVAQLVQKSVVGA